MLGKSGKRLYLRLFTFPLVLLNHPKIELRDFDYTLFACNCERCKESKVKTLFCYENLKNAFCINKTFVKLTVTILLIFSGLNLFGKSAEFTPVDRWYEVYLGDAKVGYVSDIMQKDGDVIKSRNEFVMQIKRAGQTIEITVEQETNGEAKR